MEIVQSTSRNNKLTVSSPSSPLWLLLNPQVELQFEYWRWAGSGTAQEATRPGLLAPGEPDTQSRANGEWWRHVVFWWRHVVLWWRHVVLWWRHVVLWWRHHTDEDSQGYSDKVEESKRTSKYDGNKRVFRASRLTGIFFPAQNSGYNNNTREIKTKYQK